MLVFVRKSGRIGKYSVGASQLGGTIIHHLYKTIHRSANMFSNLQGNIVGRSQHNSIETLFYSENFIQLCRNIGTTVCNTGNTGGSHSYLVSQLRVFQCQQRSHDFYSSTGIKYLICILGIEDSVGAVFNDRGSSGCDLRSLRPSGNTVGGDSRGSIFRSLYRDLKQQRKREPYGKKPAA